jgi:hypothetical protein
MTAKAVVGCALLLLAAAGSVHAQANAQELHDRIVALFSSRAPRALPAGDTLVSWYGNPILFHTVRRGGSEIEMGMVRLDRLVGTAFVAWKNARPAAGEVRWTQGDAVVLDVRLAVDRVSGNQPHSWHLPAMPWAVADYGMEDLTLPLLESLDLQRGVVSIAAYRPYGAKWDTLQVTKRAVGDGVLYELRGSDGKRDWWLASPSGSLVQLRREGQDFERRPLEQTALFEEYRRLRALLKQ